MTLPEALSLFEYWRECPPENEMLALMARVYTTWTPDGGREMTREEHQAAHMASLEARWKAGAISPKQLFESMGGGAMLGSSANSDPGDMPGIGRFPGT